MNLTDVVMDEDYNKCECADSTVTILAILILHVTTLMCVLLVVRKIYSSQPIVINIPDLNYEDYPMDVYYEERHH